MSSFFSASRLRPARAPLLLALALSLPAGAQEPAPPAESLESIPLSETAASTPNTESSATAEPTGIAEIIVTAQKKAQSLQDVPVSVGVLSGEVLQESGNFDAGALENYVANVQIDIDPQAPVIGIRGFSTETDNVGFESAVGLVVDDLALGRPEFVPDGLYDLQRIEVLRGSQGTLFGKNTVAGVINFVTVEPEPEFTGNLAVTGGDPEQRRIEGGSSLPIADSLSARIAGVYWDKQGDIDNTTLDRREGSFDQSAGRLKLLATPGERWRISLSTQYSKTEADYPPWQLFNATPAALAYARSYDADAEDDGLDAHTTADQPGFVDRKSDLSRAVIDYELGEFWGQQDFKLITVIGHAGFELQTLYDIDTSAADIVNTDFDVDYSQDSIEFRPSGRAGSLFGLGREVDWTLGLYAFRSELESDLDTIAGANIIDFALSSAGLQALGLPDQQLGPLLDLLPNLPPIPLDDSLLRGFTQQIESYAVFGQMTWGLSEKLSAIVGLRLGEDRKKADFDTQQTGIGLISAVVGAMPFTAQRKRKESDVSPKLGFQYQWQRDLMTFVTYTRGFKGGGFNATADDDSNLEFEPEKAIAYEAGVKSRLFSRSLVLNATLYRTDIRNLQVVDLTGTEFAVSNAAEARLQGVEVEAQWQPAWEWFSLTTSLAYGEAEYLDYRDAPTSASRMAQQRAEGIEPEETQDLSGKTLAHAPKFTGTLSPMLRFALGETALGLKFAVDASYRGTQFSAIDLDRNSRQEGYALLGARLLLAPDSERWVVAINGTNLTDKRALDLVFDHAVFSDSYGAVQTPLRSVSATVKFSW